MLIRTVATTLFFLTSTLAALAQDADPEAVKEALLNKIKKRLEEEHQKTLERIGKMIDEELSKESKPETKPETQPEPEPKLKPKPKPKAELPAEYEKKIKKLERDLRVLEEKREELAAEIRKTRGMAEDEKIRQEGQDKGPKGEDEAKALFDEALNEHNNKEFDSSIRKFKMLFYLFPDTQMGASSGYNVACGYALSGDKEKALDWLEICTTGGWSNWEHMRQDTDLDILRKEKRYLKLLADK